MSFPQLSLLTPFDFSLFPKMKSKLKGHHHCTLKEVQCESQMVSKALTERDFQGAFQVWQECWEQCITLQAIEARFKQDTAFAFS